MTTHSIHYPPAGSLEFRLPSRTTIGAVIVHGFTSDHRAVEPLRRIAHQMGLATETPLLRGHGGHYRDLRGVRWQHWIDDITAARSRLERQVQHVVLMGFSMGGLLALASAAEQPQNIAAIVALAPAVRIAHPLAPIAWMARGWMPYVPMGKGVAYSDPKMAVGDESYQRLALDAFCSFYYATRDVEQMLPRISAPLLVVHSHGDRVIRPQSSQIVYDRVSSRDKQLIWFKRSGHALLDDCDGPAVLDHVQRFLQTRLGPLMAGPSSRNVENVYSR